MKGHVAKKGNRYYAVIYEGLDPISSKEIRKWHPAGTCRDEAEALARQLADEIEGANGSTRSLTFGAYLVQQWLPGKANTLAESGSDSVGRADANSATTASKLTPRRSASRCKRASTSSDRSSVTGIISS